MKWAVPKDLWAGRTVAILASGPSMSQSVADTVRARGVACIAINTTYQLAMWADMLYAADHQWWMEYGRKLGEFKGLRVSIGNNWNPPVEVLTLWNTGQNGFDENPANIRSGCNSGYQAIHIAIAAGAQRIELHGMDMKSTKDGVHHWHGLHPRSLRNHGNGIYDGWIKHFATLLPVAKAKGIAIVNCTPGSALQCFPFEAAPPAPEQQEAA